MIPAKPFKVVCPKCNDEKIVKPKSDAINPLDFSRKCLKCNMLMVRK